MARGVYVTNSARFTPIRGGGSTHCCVALGAKQRYAAKEAVTQGGQNDRFVALHVSVWYAYGSP